jgi:L-glutamine-phosphate cytidylyltransferase
MGDVLIVLAAGKGTRMKALTKDQPKCMVKFERKAILHHQLEVASDYKSLDVVIASGYQSSKIETPGVRILFNERYAETNMAYTLFDTLSKMHDVYENYYISYGDIIYSSAVFKKMYSAQHEVAIAADTNWQIYWKMRMDNILDDAESFITNEHGEVVELGHKINDLDQAPAQYIGLSKFTKSSIRNAMSHWHSIRGLYSQHEYDNLFMTDFIQSFIRAGNKVNSVLIDGGWMEFDTPSDLSIKRRY